MRILPVALLFFCIPVLSQNGLRPTTTLAAETANNTSAVTGSANRNSQPGNVSKLPIRSLLYPGSSTLVLARFMVWFGDKGHKEFGYRSDDARQVARQVEDMLSHGIDGAVVDWYGADAAFKNRATELLFREAERRGLKVAISVDAGALKSCKDSGCDMSAKLASDLKYIAEHFESSPAYLRIGSRPLVTFFGMEKYTLDWDRIREQVQGKPRFLFRNSGAFQFSFGDGAYSWIAPETVKPGNPYGFEYLEHFQKVAQQHSGKFVMGSVYKGFDDSAAGWGKGRRIDQNCGRTWLGTFDVLKHFYSESHPLPALIVVTWNDWEEGTEVESGIDDCISIRAVADSGHLRWELAGPTETLDHYEVFASENGTDLALIARKPVGERDLELGSIGLPPGRYTFYVKAVAKPFLLNHMSNAVVIDIPAKK